MHSDFAKATPPKFAEFLDGLSSTERFRSIERPNVPEIVRNLVPFGKIKEPKELNEEVSPSAEPDFYSLFEKPSNFVDEIDIEDANETHDWQTDYRLYSQNEQNMKEQLSVLQKDKNRKLVELKHPLELLTTGQRQAYDVVATHFKQQSKKQLSLGIFGGPGTGKSVCINAIQHLTQLACATFGPTGKVAFLNAGDTLHSGLQFAPGSKPNYSQKGNEKFLKPFQAKFKGVKYFIIDEISMVGQTLFTWVHTRLQMITGKYSQPFGGLNVIIVGDFAQTPPIGDRSLYKPSFAKSVAGGELYQRFKTMIVLSDADNQRQETTARHADSQAAGNLEAVLYLCEGALVSLTKKLSTQTGLTNGTTGIVKAIIYKPETGPPGLPMCVVVQFEHLKNKIETCLPGIPGCFAVAPKTSNWESGSKNYTRTQIPLTLAYGLTIHKAQGQTLSSVVIQIDKAKFAAGLLYVALNRVHALEDLLIDDFEESYLTTRLAKSEAISFRINEESRQVQLYQKTVKAWFSGSGKEEKD